MSPLKDNALDRYSRSYESLTRFVSNATRMRAETALQLIDATATYASAHHPGRLYDGALENVAYRIGSTLPAATPEEVAKITDRPRRDAGGRRRVLHVAPFMWRVGGHTRTLQNWVELDTSSQHSIALTRSLDSSLADNTRRLVDRHGGGLFVMSNAQSLLDRARMLRAIAQQDTDLVVLHHTCNDVIPTVALAKEGLPPVGLVNDCDQAYWLGSSVTDIIINQREAGARLSRERRHPGENAVLPIPLPEPLRPTRAAAREALGISADQLVLLTVGRAIKYRSSGSHDFFRTVRIILGKEPRAHLYIVGLTPEEATEWKLDWRHERIHLCGPQSELSNYRSAADLYLESMPFGSATALMEAAQVGLPVAFPFSPPLDLFVTNHGLETILDNPRDEAEYVAGVMALLGDAGAREKLGRALEAHMSSHHIGNAWRTHVAELYAVTDRIVHRPNSIPPTQSMDSALDVALSEWQTFLNAAAQTRDPAYFRDIPLNVAASARDRGDYGGLIEILWQYWRTFGIDRKMLKRVFRLPVAA